MRPAGQNFSWASNLVSLPGRAGLDLALGIGYNSLVWTKADNEIFVDTDNSNVSPGFRLGFPTIEPVYYDDDNSKFAYMMEKEKVSGLRSGDFLFLSDHNRPFKHHDLV